MWLSVSCTVYKVLLFVIVYEGQCTDECAVGLMVGCSTQTVPCRSRWGVARQVYDAASSGRFKIQSAIGHQMCRSTSSVPFDIKCAVQHQMYRSTTNVPFYIKRAVRHQMRRSTPRVPVNIKFAVTHQLCL